MGQAEQPSMFPEVVPPSGSITGEAARLEAERRALEDRIIRLSRIAEDMDAAAQAFAGASLGMDVRSPNGGAQERDDAYLRASERTRIPTEDEPDHPQWSERAHYEVFCDGWRLALAGPIPDGPALPEDPETWAKMRRALKLGRPLARLAREVAEGIGELRKAARR